MSVLHAGSHPPQVLEKLPIPLVQPEGEVAARSRCVASSHDCPRLFCLETIPTVDRQWVNWLSASGCYFTVGIGSRQQAVPTATQRVGRQSTCPRKGFKMSDLLQELKKLAEFEYLASLGDDRHLFRVPIEAVEEHEDFQRLRGKAVEKIDLLQASMRRTGHVRLPSLRLRRAGRGRGHPPVHRGRAPAVAGREAERNPAAGGPVRLPLEEPDRRLRRGHRPQLRPLRGRRGRPYFDPADGKADRRRSGEPQRVRRDDRPRLRQDRGLPRGPATSSRRRPSEG